MSKTERSIPQFSWRRERTIRESLPWQVDKMAARLQAATSSGKPVLLRVSYHGGHQIIGGTEAQFQETLADEMSFLLWQLGDPAFQPKGEKQ